MFRLFRVFGDAVALDRRLMGMLFSAAWRSVYCPSSTFPISFESWVPYILVFQRTWKFLFLMATATPRRSFKNEVKAKALPPRQVPGELAEAGEEYLRGALIPLWCFTVTLDP